MEPRISVIVPVYRTEKYLERCVDSIRNQTYENLEIILVDDGSPDRCPQICDEIRRQDKRVKVIHKKNGGLSSARNAGLVIAEGDFIGFVDSDDFILPDMYEYLCKILTENNAEIADIRCKYVYEGENSIIQQDSEQINVYRAGQILERYLYRGLNENKGAPFTVWRKLYRREIISNSRFEEGTLNEDICFNFMILAKCNTYVESSRIEYCYLQNSEGITGGPLKNRDLDLLSVCNQLVRLAEKTNNEKIITLAKMKRVRSDFSLLARAALNGTEDVSQQEITQLQKHLRANLPLLLRSPMPLNRKILSIGIATNYKLIRKLKTKG